MNNWNYRVFKEHNEYYIAEVHYNKNHKPILYSNAISPYGETLKDLKEDLEWMLKAFNKEVLTPEDFA